MTDIFTHADQREAEQRTVIRANLKPRYESPHAQWQVVELVNRTGKGKITVRETVGRRGIFAVLPFLLHEVGSTRVRLSRETLLSLPWRGAGPDPGIPLSREEAEAAGEVGLDL